MTRRILHIEASPRSERSRSTAIANVFLTALAEHQPGLEVQQINLFDAGLPAFDGAAIAGRYRLIAGLDVDAQERAAWAELRRWGDELLSFDIWLFSVPMWNFGIPYVLKQYIDVVTHPGLLFRNSHDGATVEGLATGRRAIIVAASAMPITADGPLAQFDFQAAYLKAWLKFVGIAEIDTVRVAPTFGAEDVVDATMAEACKAARSLARSIAA